jgi:hypothetical protein
VPLRLSLLALTNAVAFVRLLPMNDVDKDPDPDRSTAVRPVGSSGTIRVREVMPCRRRVRRPRSATTPPAPSATPDRGCAACCTRCRSQSPDLRPLTAGQLHGRLRQDLAGTTGANLLSGDPPTPIMDSVSGLEPDPDGQHEKALVRTHFARTRQGRGTSRSRHMVHRTSCRPPARSCSRRCLLGQIASSVKWQRRCPAIGRPRRDGSAPARTRR